MSKPRCTKQRPQLYPDPRRFDLKTEDGVRAFAVEMLDTIGRAIEAGELVHLSSVLIARRSRPEVVVCPVSAIHRHAPDVEDVTGLFVACVRKFVAQEPEVYAAITHSETYVATTEAGTDRSELPDDLSQYPGSRDGVCVSLEYGRGKGRKIDFWRAEVREVRRGKRVRRSVGRWEKNGGVSSGRLISLMEGE